MKTFKTIFLLMSFTLMIVEPTHANNSCFRKEKDAWQILINVLDSYQVKTTDLDVTSRFSSTLQDNNKLDLRNDIESDLAKAYRVKKPVSIEPNAMLGEIVCAFMEAKYARKNGEKYDYYKIRYSPVVDDEYLCFKAKYPNSRYNEELESKSSCVKQNAAWHSCKDNKDCHVVYDRYGVCCCPYDGYRVISERNNKCRKTMEDWDELQQSWDGGLGADGDRYAYFIQNHDTLANYYTVAYDSLNVCRQRQAWHTACEEHSIEGYRSYVMNYPNSKEAFVAKLKIEEMVAWQQAVEANTHESYGMYYTNYPEGDSVAVAAEKLRLMEEEDWGKAQKQNTIRSYERFVAQYPNGYYTESALECQIRLEIERFKGKGKGSIDKLELEGISSRQGYGLLCFGNVGRNFDITVSMLGNTPVKVNMKPGQCQWVWAKNGEYQIYVTSSNGSEWEENGHGTVLIEDGLYYNRWYSWVSSYYISPEQSKIFIDEGASVRIDSEVVKRICSEVDKAMLLDIDVQRKMLRNYYRQFCEKTNDKEEFEKILRDLEDDENVIRLIKGICDPYTLDKIVLY